MLLVAEIDQRVEVSDAFDPDIAAAAAVTAVGAAILNVFLAAEGNAAITALAGFDVDLCLIKELHRIAFLNASRVSCLLIILTFTPRAAK